MLSKSQLKRMFLRVLYEIQYGKMKNYSHGIDNIVSHWMNEYWELKMTDEDIQRTYEAIQELKTSGLIVKDASQREEVFQVLTPKGVEVVEKQKDLDVHGLQLEAVIKNPELLKTCIGAFNDDNYENAIFYGICYWLKISHQDAVKLAPKVLTTDFKVEGIQDELRDKVFSDVLSKFQLPSE